MSSACCVVNIANGEVEGIIFILARCDRYRCFVAAKDNRDKDGTLCLRVFGYDVLHYGSEIGSLAGREVLTDCLQAQSPDMKSLYRRSSLSSYSRYAA